MSYDLQYSFHKPHIVSWTTKIWYQYYKWCVIFCTSACLKTFASDRKKDFVILHYIEPFSLNIDISVINESRSRFLSILKVQSFCTYEPFSYKDTGLQNQSQLRLTEVKKVPLSNCILIQVVRRKSLIFDLVCTVNQVSKICQRAMIFRKSQFLDHTHFIPLLGTVFFKRRLYNWYLFL